MKLLLTVILGVGLICSNTYAAKNQQVQTLTKMGKQNKMQTPQDINKIQGEKFLSENKNKPGVVTLPDGLQYKILVEGKGEKPKVTDTVTVHYAGTSIDGKEFDSSYKRGEPTSFPLGAVIAGWTKALQLMPVGSTWELYIPSDLAYGLRGAPPVIGPNEVLIFKVELIGIKK